jgi:hypothetical protein
MRCCVAVVLMIGCAGSESGTPEPRRCLELREHLVELQVDDIHFASGIDREAHRRALKQALGDHFVEQCTSRLTEGQVSCALGAADQAVAAACAR